MTDSHTPFVSQELNRYCQCIGTDVPALRRRFDSEMQKLGVQTPLAMSHPHLFSSLPVFVDNEQTTIMQQVINAIESIIALPTFSKAALALAPSIAHHAQRTRGVFMGYDFHISADGPKLIEINTNAGGACLCLEMLRSQEACCVAVKEFLASRPTPTQIESEWVAMFKNEWRLARGTAPLKTIALVDIKPSEQYLHPEFLLWQKSMQSHGVNAVIVDPSELRYENAALWHGDNKVDLIYNRLTDFFLQIYPQLASAYIDDAVVITPDPRAYALYADKRNLILLSDDNSLKQLGVPASVRALLTATIPKTMLVNSADADHWWRDRKQWFFKPAHGFGSRGSYRGDKLTRTVFNEIVSSPKGEYIAQQCVPPGERWVGSSSEERALKFDVRNYVYAGNVQLLAARTYQGQTTNFRTEGGGFAPVYSLCGSIQPIDISE